MPTFQPHGRISILYSRHLCYCSLNICILDRKHHICFVRWYHLPYFYECFEIIDSGHHVSKTSIAVLRASSCVFTQPTIGSEITIFNNMCMRSKCLNLSHRTVMPYMESSLANLWFVNLVHRTRVVSVQSYLLQKNFTFSPICGMIQLSEWCILWLIWCGINFIKNNETEKFQTHYSFGIYQFMQHHRQ